MPGTRAQPKNVATVVQGYSNAAVTASQVLTEFVAPVWGRITGIKANAQTAGTGAGNTVIDVLKNGTSIWVTAAQRPTLAAASTGEFNNALGSPGRTGVRPGDVLSVTVATIPATTGHARVMASVAIEANA